MFIEAIIIGIVIGLFRNGKLYRLSYMDFNLSILPYIAAVFYIGIIIMNLGLLDLSSSLYSISLLASYILIGLFIIANISKKYMFIPLIGFCLNFICFIVNGLKFPISSDATLLVYGSEIHNLLVSGKIKYFIPAENATLSFLGNIIPINKLFSMTILSIGDIIIAFGIMIIVQLTISDKRIKSKNKITFSKDIFK